METSLWQLCRACQAVPLEQNQHTLTLAVHEPLSGETLARLQFATGYTIVTRRYDAAEFARLTRTAEKRFSEASVTAENSASPHSAAAFSQHLISTAITRRASDIHLEPSAAGYTIRLRIDGVLQCLATLRQTEMLPIISRLKVLAQLDIAEKRLPQDGQLTFMHGDKNYSLRIATLPVQGGEKVVLRLLQTQHDQPGLTQLGMEETHRRQYLQALQLPQGLILVTGPTGSGKTFTLYSGIAWLNTPERNICSVEDPVEIPLEGVNQTQVNPKSELSFQRILRALLRQDPDVIMIGEIRDPETAEIAVNASQTGHLVLSTLHTNSTIETLIRLVRMGIPGYLLASSLQLIIAQRLVRRLCPHCKIAAPPLTTLPTGLWQGTLSHWLPGGCERCVAGYFQRCALYELLPITDALRLRLLKARSVERVAVPRPSITSLLSDGLLKVSQGITSLAEVYRVTGAHYG